MNIKKRWIALVLGAVLTATGGYGALAAESQNADSSALNYSRPVLMQAAEKRAYEVTDTEWKALLNDFEKIADLDSSGDNEAAATLWEELIIQVDDKLGIFYDEEAYGEGVDDTVASLEDLKGWAAYISTFEDLIDDSNKYGQIMDFAHDLDSLDPASPMIGKLEAQIALFLADALENVDLTEVEGVFADASEYEGVLSETDMETYEQLMNLYIMDEEAGKFEEAQDKYDEIIDLLNQYPELMGEAEGELYAQFNVNNEQLSYVKNPVDEMGDPLEITEVSSEDIEKYQLLWDYVIKLMPDAATDYIDKFEVGSDGRDGTMAFVYPADGLGNKFVLNLDINDMTNENGTFNKKDMDETIVHEFGHVLTLNSSQMINSSAGTYETQEGILAKDSYLNLFYNKFWKDKTDKYLLSNEDGYREYDVEKLFTDHESWFVSDYAATNVEEDIAESFRVFVLENKASGNGIKDQKVNFFYQFPELVKMRNEIRDGK